MGTELTTRCDKFLKHFQAFFRKEIREAEMHGANLDVEDLSEVCEMLQDDLQSIMQDAAIKFADKEAVVEVPKKSRRKMKLQLKKLEKELQSEGILDEEGRLR